jgi:hypothetical protein
VIRSHNPYTQIVLCSVVGFTCFARGWEIFEVGNFRRPLEFRNAHHLFDKSPKPNPRCLKLELCLPGLLKLKTQTLHPLLSSGSFFLRQHLIKNEISRTLEQLNGQFKNSNDVG